MAKKASSTADKMSQLERFKETAREVETDDSEEAFDRTLRRVVKAPPSKKAGKANEAKPAE